MGSLWAAGLLLRRLRSERGIIFLIVVLVVATSTVFAAAPRLFNRASDAALQQALEVAPASQRNVAMRLDGRMDVRDLAGARTYGDRLASRIPASIAALVADRFLLVTSARLLLPEPPSYETHLSLRYQDGLAAATRLVAGRWPADLGIPLRQVDLGGNPGEPGEPGEPGGEPIETAVFEIAFSAAQATELGAELGDRYDVVLDGSDPLVRGTAFRIGPAEVEVVGIYEPLDANAAFWSGDDSLLAADVRGDEDAPIAFATAYIAPEAYPQIWSSGLPFHYEWRFVVDPTRMDADQVPGLQADLPRLDRIGGGGTATVPGTVLVRTGLAAILEHYVTERALAEAVLSIAAIGPFALAIGALAMVAILLIRRRAATLALVRGRGASGSLVLGAQLWEAIILAGGASLVGLAIAVVIVPARTSPISAILAICVGAATTLLLVGASWRAARRPLGQPERDDAPVLRVAPRRLVIEGTIVVVAVAATLLLRQRGLVIAADDAAGADPLLASVPVLAGLAAGIVALRLYPLPIRGLGWLAARRRDLVPVLGLRTIGRRSGAANLPLLALMLTAAFGAFTSVVASSLDRSQTVATYLEIGSDYRLERIGSNTFTNLDPAAIPGVEAGAAGYVDPSAPFAATPRQRATIYLAAVDPAAYERVTAGTPADARLPASFLTEPSPDGLGSEANPIPAILSAHLPAGTTPLAVGDVFQMTVASQTMSFRVVERRAAFPGIDNLDFSIVPLTWVRAAHDDHRVLASQMWLRGSADVAGAVAAAIDGASGDARIVSRHAAYAALRGNSMGQTVVAGYGLAVLVAAIYMALTIIGALILSAARRTRDLAYLRTLGVSAPQSLALTVMEHAPPVLLAFVPGIALGIGIAVLVLPSLGLGAFAGTSGPVPLFVDGRALAVLVVGLIGVVAAAVVAGTWLSRRARLVNGLRMGED